MIENKLKSCVQARTKNPLKENTDIGKNINLPPEDCPIEKPVSCE